VPHGGEYVEETGGGDQASENPEGAPDPENGGERSGEQRAANTQKATRRTRTAHDTGNSPAAAGCIAECQTQT
jgi:hypothetical protein